MSLKVKLVGAFFLMAALVLALSYLNARAVHYIHDSFSDIVDNHVPRVSALQTMRVLAVKTTNDVMDFGEDSSSGISVETQKDQLLDDLQKMAEQERTYLSLTAQDKATPTKEASAPFRQVIAAKAKLADAVPQLIALKEHKTAPAVIAAKEAELSKIQADLDRSIAAATQKNLDFIRAKNQASDARARELGRATSIASSLTVAFAVILGLWIAVIITRNLKNLKEAAMRVAGGDFTKAIPVRSQDEVGQLADAFNQMSSRLRESYQRLAVEAERDKTLLESLGEGLIAIDAGTNIALINSHAIELLELSGAEKVLNIPVNHAFTIYDQKDNALSGEHTPVVQALRTKQPVSNIFTFHKKGGDKILLDIGANPVIMSGKLVGAIMTFRDVTKEKEIDRMKTEFISLASHQLRTPLSAIRWFSEMLVSGDAGDLGTEQMDFAKNIYQSTERMIALVNALLNISRMESGRIMIDPKPTDLRGLVASIADDLKIALEQKQQTLVISAHPDLPKINLDHRLIGQVYLNLLTNAVKYTPKGGEITVFISKKDDQVISQISDNGLGIPKDQHDRIFQKFFRATNAVRVETDGTGLGLYLTKAIVEASGGKIWFKSEENQGCTFWFSIPLSGMKAKEGEVTLDV